MRARAQSRLPTQLTGLFLPAIGNLSLHHSHLSEAHTLLNVFGATFLLTMSPRKPLDAARKNLSHTAWSALRQNNWREALEIIPQIDFTLDDIVMLSVKLIM